MSYPLGYHEMPPVSNSHLTYKTVRPTPVPPIHGDPLHQLLPYIEYVDEEVGAENQQDPDFSRYCVGNKCYYYQTKNYNRKQLTNANLPLTIGDNSIADDSDDDWIMFFSHMWRFFCLFLINTMHKFVH